MIPGLVSSWLVPLLGGLATVANVVVLAAFSLIAVAVIFGPKEGVTYGE